MNLLFVNFVYPHKICYLLLNRFTFYNKIASPRAIMAIFSALMQSTESDVCTISDIIFDELYHCSL